MPYLLHFAALVQQMLYIRLKDYSRACGGGGNRNWRGKIGHRQPAPARPAAPGRRGREGGRGERARLESIAAAGPSMVSNVGGRGGERRGGGQRTLQPYLECDPKKRAVLARRAKRSTIY